MESTVKLRLLVLIVTVSAVSGVFTWPKDYVLSNKASLPQRPAVEGTFRLAVDNGGTRITSPGGDYALGFLDHDNAGRFTLSIVFIPFFSSPKGTEIWSANRDRPVGDNARLMRETNGNLVLVDSDGTRVWSSDAAAESMDLGDNGNWVLYNNANSSSSSSTQVWSSWDHPTNTLTIGQIFRSGQRLVSNASPTNSSQGRFSLAAEKGGLVLYTSPQSLPYWVWAFTGISYQYIKNPCTSGPLIAQAVFSANLIALANVGGSVGNKTNGSSASCYPSSTSETLPFHTFKGESRLRFLRLDWDGNLRAYMAAPVRGIMGSNPQEWSVDYELFPSSFNCSLPSVCGPYGVCSRGQCSCPADMFKMREPFQPDAGCSPPRALELTGCQRRQMKMVEVQGLHYYPNDYVAPAANATTMERCKALCAADCGCVAGFFRGDRGACFLAFNSVDSLQYVASNRRAVYTGFLKVQT